MFLSCKCAVWRCLLQVDLINNLVSEKKAPQSYMNHLSIRIHTDFICTQHLSTGFCILVRLQDQLEGNGGDRKTLSVPHDNTQKSQSATVDILIYMCVCVCCILIFIYLFICCENKLKGIVWEILYMHSLCHWELDDWRLISLSCLLDKYRHKSYCSPLPANK